MTTDTKIAEELRNLYSAIAPAMWSGESEECVLDKADAALLDRAAARIEALEARTYAHMCRMDHVEIGFNDSEVEPCPLCVANGTITRLRALVESAYRDAELLRSALQGIIVEFHARGLAVPNRLWKQAADALDRLERAT